MSFDNSPFYIFPQVEATYDLNLSAAFLRASLVVKPYTPDTLRQTIATALQARRLTSRQQLG